MRLSRVALSVAFATSLASSAHAQGIAGKWAVIWDSDISMDHDTVVVKQRRPAMLELVVKGDSVTGKWGTGIEQGLQFRGTFDGRTLRMTTGVNDRVVKRDGESITMKVRWDLTGALQGSKLAGSVFIYIGDRPAPARRWEAQRAP